MRILNAELRKTLTLRFFLILVLAIVANLLLFRNYTSQKYLIYDQQAFIAAQQDVLQVEPDQRLDYLTEQSRMISACQRWETYDSLVQSGIADTDYINEEMLRYQSVYESGACLKYTNSLFSESMLIRDLLDDLQQVSSHGDTLENVIQEAKVKTGVSIFAKPGTFSYRNQLNIIQRFEQLKGIAPIYDVSDGVLNAQSSAATDLIALLLILILCTQMIVTEHKNGILPILRATRKGRLLLILSKVAVTFILTFVVTGVLWGGNLIYSGSVFGLGDLSRPVQSLSGFTACRLKLTVGQYLCLFMLHKWLIYAAVGILCLIMALVWRSAMPTWLTVGGFLGIEYILVKTIAPISAWNTLRYINISNLIFETDWLSAYRNLDFFGYPVEVFTASIILTATLLAGGVLLLCWQFCRRKIRVLPQLKWRLHWPRWLPRPGARVSLLSHENWKLLIECGVLAVLVLFLLIHLQEPKTSVNSIEELYYKNYMEVLSGPLTAQKEAYLDSEMVRFDEIRSQIAQLQQDCAEGKISQDVLELALAPLSRALEAEEVLVERVLPYRDRLLALQAEGKEGWFVYEKGYHYLFGLDYHEKAGAAALVLAAVILCFSNLFPMETARGMQPLLNVYQKGRRKTAATKLLICAGYAAALYLIAQIPDYWYVAENYGFSSLTAPLCSIEAFAVWGDNLPIWGGIAVFEALRLITILSLTMVILLLSQWIGSQVITLSVSAGVLLIPVLLHLLGITLLDNISFYLPLTGTELMRRQDFLGKFLLYYLLTAVLGIVCILLNLRFAANGYRMNPRKTSK